MCPKNGKNVSQKAKCLSLLSCIITIIQFCIIIGCLVCLIVQGVQCIEKYLKKDTRVIQNVMPLKSATFLAFTVCPSYDDAYKLQVLQSYGTSKDIYKKGRTIVFTFYSILHSRLYTQLNRDSSKFYSIKPKLDIRLFVDLTEFPCFVPVLA